MSEPLIYPLFDPESRQVSEPTPYYGASNDESEDFSGRLGNEEWFLAYSVNLTGDIEGLEETTTYSFTLASDGRARVQDYILTKSRNGELSTEQTFSKNGYWNLHESLLILVLEEETLEFAVVSVENGTATLMDPDDQIISVFMTESALRRVTQDRAGNI